MAAALFVTTNALAARPPALIALPALKPNQPNQSSDAPRTVMVASCGSIGSRPRPLRRPSTSAATSAETPLVMCTTVPPAKSSVPSILSQPPVPQTQCATGSYTNVAQRSVNTTNALKRLRSANAPAVEEAERGRHEHDQGSGREEPGGVPGVDVLHAASLRSRRRAVSSATGAVGFGWVVGAAQRPRDWRTFARRGN